MLAVEVIIGVGFGKSGAEGTGMKFRGSGSYLTLEPRCDKLCITSRIHYCLLLAHFELAIGFTFFLNIYFCCRCLSKQLVMFTVKGSVDPEQIFIGS